MQNDLDRVLDFYLGIGHKIFRLFYSELVKHLELVEISITIYLLFKATILIWNILHKRYLIIAFAQQLCDEVSRLDIKSIEEVSNRIENIWGRFVIDGLGNIYDNQKSMFWDSTGDAEILYKASNQAIDFRNQRFVAFLSERKVIRWLIDGLEALIGEHKSIEVAWSKGLIYLIRFNEINDKSVFPWMPSYMKLLNLPHNHLDENFSVKIKAESNRWYPKGYISLYLASRLFDYIPNLRYFNKRGQNAWNELIQFKATLKK